MNHGSGQTELSGKTLAEEWGYKAAIVFLLTATVLHTYNGHRQFCCISQTHACPERCMPRKMPAVGCKPAPLEAQGARQGDSPVGPTGSHVACHDEGGRSKTQEWRGNSQTKTSPTANPIQVQVDPVTGLSSILQPSLRPHFRKIFIWQKQKFHEHLWNGWHLLLPS